MLSFISSVSQVILLYETSLHTVAATVTVCSLLKGKECTSLRSNEV